MDAYLLFVTLLMSKTDVLISLLSQTVECLVGNAHFILTMKDSHCHSARNQQWRGQWKVR